MGQPMPLKSHWLLLLLLTVGCDNPDKFEPAQHLPLGWVRSVNESTQVINFETEGGSLYSLYYCYGQRPTVWQGMHVELDVRRVAAGNDITGRCVGYQILNVIHHPPDLGK